MLFPQKINVVASARHANPHNETVVVQNDTAVEFYVAVVGDNGQTELPEGATYTLVCLHLRKQPTEKLGTLQADGNVMFKLTHMELSETGPVQGQVRVYHPVGGRLTSNPFIFHVAPDPTYGAEIKPEDQSIIEQVIGEGPGIIAEAKKETELNITERARLTGAVGGALSSLADDKAQALLEMSQSKDAADQSAQVAQQAADNADEERERLTLDVSDKLNEVETARSATVEATGEATEAAGLARDEAEAARLQKEEVQDILGAGPVASVNGKTGVVTGLATQESVDQVTAQLAEKVGGQVKAKMEDLDDEVISAVTGGATVTVLSIPQDKSVTPEKTNFITVGKNKFNPKTAVADTYLSTAGNPSSAPGYHLSEFIPVDIEPYHFSKARRISFYDANKVHLAAERVDNSHLDPLTRTPTTKGFVRFAIPSADLYTFQMEKGSVQTAFEPYKLVFDGVDVGLFDITKRVDDIETTLLGGNPTADQQHALVYKTGETVKVRAKFDEINDLVVTAAKKESANQLFNFAGTWLVPQDATDSAVISESIGDKFHTAGDDVAPVRTFTVVGANHGYTTIVEVTQAGHGKTKADYGSQWTDGTTVYVLLFTEGDKLTFTSPYTEVDGIVTAPRKAPVADLTHVSGATNTAVVSISSIVTSGQLYPSVKNVTRKHFADGVEVVADGSYKCENYEVRESYEIIDYKALVDYTKANIGKDYRENLDSIDGVIRLSINYQFNEKANCVIYQSFQALKKVAIENSGFIQAQGVGYSSHSMFQYIPNVKPKLGYDFKNLINAANIAETFYFNPADYLNPEIPVHRFVSWLRNTTTNVKKVGFTMGFIPDKDDSSHERRLANTTESWEFRGSTRKNYPIGLTPKTLDAGQYYHFIGYRNYISANEYSDATNVSTVEVGNETYVYIDYHVSKPFERVKLPNLVGKKIDTLEKNADFTLHNGTVDADGISFSVKNGYGYAVLKVS